jgi:hypothetical protein
MIDPITEYILENDESLQESDIILGSIALIYRKILIDREREAALLRNRTIGGIVLAAIIATAAYKVYKGYLSKAAKACQGRKGEDKTKCMKDYKRKAVQEEIKAMTKLMSECSKSKEPVKCKNAIKKKIDSKKKKLRGN